uniref:uncharacterized protein LOC113475662 n=1 Tax=Ciona intestinalis TaxID=7719 RepID=UPI000EF49A2E|nr:uncharacterized protein LOC113475662 [Ciona intestinalis]|eukprot:XP_026695904.1 uncharacterized protein LOC113475662 [Ciona intestinalis]
MYAGNPQQRYDVCPIMTLLVLCIVFFAAMTKSGILFEASIGIAVVAFLMVVYAVINRIIARDNDVIELTNVTSSSGSAMGSEPRDQEDKPPDYDVIYPTPPPYDQV